MNEGVVEMLEYTRWANRRLLEACREAPDTALDAPPAGISGTVRELLVHLVGGQQSFVLRTKGRQHEGELSRRSAWPGFDSLASLLAEADAALLQVARELDGGEMVELPWMGKSYAYPVRFFLTHSVSHSAEHRTEIKVGLSAQGIETPNLDAWDFAGAQGYGVEA